MTATLTEAIRDQISVLPRWPVNIDRVQNEIRIESIGRTAARYLQPEKSALRKVNAVTQNDSDSDPELFTHNFAGAWAIALSEIEEGEWTSLRFPVMDDREEDIAIAELKTFEWILKEPQDKQRTWDSFIRWLEYGDTLYWVNGKAGSGKSTLMKYLKDHPTFIEILNRWAAGTPLIMASFFFWYNGNTLQKTQEGLLRSLLYQALEGHRELITIVLSGTHDSSGYQTNDWSLPRLKQAFKNLVEQQEVPLKICLLVDGLDEYSGEHSEIAEVFQYAAKFDHIKICVSSRPLLPFDRAFKGFPGLMLQNLTFDDIQAYVEKRFNDNSSFQELKIEEPGIGPDLALQVVNKASGVFLWVKLVVHSLLEGIQNFDRSIDLERRLEELPEDLDDLYWHMLDRVDRDWYLEEGFKLLLLAHTAVIPLTLLQLTFVDLGASVSADSIDIMPIERQNACCKSMAGRIKSRCLGLLEVTDMTCTDIKHRRVQFLHKSVKDFIETPRMMARMHSKLSNEKSFIPQVAIIQALSCELRTVKGRLHKDQFSEENGMTRETWFDEVRPIIFEIVRYAAVAEKGIPKFRDKCVPLITEAEKITTDLWELVGFRASEEINGSVHWSVAPRKPGAATRERETKSNGYGEMVPETLPGDKPPGFLVHINGPVTSNPDSEHLISVYSQVQDIPDSSKVSEKNISLADMSSRLCCHKQFRFKEPPGPKGDDNDDERPQRRWPGKSIDSGDSPYKLEKIDSITCSGFEYFVRSLGLEHYANERFGAHTETQERGRVSKSGAAPEEVSVGYRTRVRKVKQSLASRLKSFLPRERT